jgi:hypothetical protein
MQRWKAVLFNFRSGGRTWALASQLAAVKYATIPQSISQYHTFRWIGDTREPHAGTHRTRGPSSARLSVHKRRQEGPSSKRAATLTIRPRPTSAWPSHRQTARGRGLRLGTRYRGPRRVEVNGRCSHHRSGRSPGQGAGLAGIDRRDHQGGPRSYKQIGAWSRGPQNYRRRSSEPDRRRGLWLARSIHLISAPSDR